MIFVKEKLGRWFKRYLVDATGSMAMGLFASLIIGLIISQLSKIPYMSWLSVLSSQTAASSPIIGAAIGVAVAHGLGAKPLVVFTSAVTGALGYAAGDNAGGPVGAYLASVIGAEVGGLVASKTKVDIVVTPFVTILSGGLIGVLVGPYIGKAMTALGTFVNNATTLAPIPMGIVVSVVVGMALTAPISSAALCISIGIDGIAAGAACVGCCCNMIGFAVASYRDNGIGGLISQGVGTSMVQVPNIMRYPQIWLAPICASAVLGPISSAALGMTNTKVGAGMGTSGLVGQFGAIDAMSAAGDSALTIAIQIALMHFILPAALTLGFDFIFRKIGWVKPGMMKLGVAGETVSAAETYTTEVTPAAEITSATEATSSTEEKAEVEEVTKDE